MRVGKKTWKPTRKVLIFLGVIVLCIWQAAGQYMEYHKNNTVGAKMQVLLSEYVWYDDVIQHQRQFRDEDSRGYDLRYRIAEYLEREGFYWAENTAYCEDIDTENRNQRNDTCYIGTAEQNHALLAALNRDDVKKELKYLKPRDIINGKNNERLIKFQQYAAKYCTDSNQSCSWQEHVDAMRALTRWSIQFVLMLKRPEQCSSLFSIIQFFYS